MALVLLLSFWQPSTTLAQTDEYGEGVAADQATTDEVIAMAETFIEGFNNHDSSIVDLVSPGNYMEFFVSSTRADAVAQVENQADDSYNRQIIVYELGDVLEHENHHVSVGITYSGWVTDAFFTTDRWYLMSTDSGYLFDGYSRQAPKIPEELISAKLEITLTRTALAVDKTQLNSAQVLIINTINDDTRSLVIGLFAPIDETMTPVDAQTLLG